MNAVAGTGGQSQGGFELEKDDNRSQQELNASRKPSDANVSVQKSASAAQDNAD